MTRATFCGRRGMRPLAVRCGRLEDHRLVFNIPIGPGERGVANVVAELGARTWVVLYLLPVAECDRLDHTEGVHMGVYQRLPVEVLVEGDGPVAAFTYQSSMTTEGRKPSLRYMTLLLDGAREH